MTKRHGTTMLIAFAAIVYSTLGTGCGSGGGPKLTPEQKTGASAVCQKAADCSAASPSSSEMSDCKTQVAGALQLFPDPDKFAACVNSKSCSDLEDSSSTEIRACLDLNRDSYECSDSSTLTGCNNSGGCASAPCSDVCDLMGGTFDHCGPSNNPDKAKNICWCRQ